MVAYLLCMTQTLAPTHGGPQPIMTLPPPGQQTEPNSLNVLQVPSVSSSLLAVGGLALFGASTALGAPGLAAATHAALVPATGLVGAMVLTGPALVAGHLFLRPNVATEVPVAALGLGLGAAGSVAELHRLDALVGGLLELGRAERLPADEVVELDAILVRLTTAHGISVSGSAGLVLGNRPALETVVGNLVDNARQHGGTHVEVHTWRNATQAGFDVIDDGPGIDAASEAQLFERFFTTDRSQGVGLGLAVVRGLVRAHGGEIHAHCEPGRTRFSVTLRGEETSLAKHGREHLVVESDE